MQLSLMLRGSSGLKLLMAYRIFGGRVSCGLLIVQGFRKKRIVEVEEVVAQAVNDAGVVAGPMGELHMHILFLYAIHGLETGSLHSAETENASMLV